eukprot:2926030-Rhodomonas_salina.1
MPVPRIALRQNHGPHSGYPTPAPQPESKAGNDTPGTNVRGVRIIPFDFAASPGGGGGPPLPPACSLVAAHTAPWPPPPSCQHSAPANMSTASINARIASITISAVDHEWQQPCAATNRSTLPP